MNEEGPWIPEPEELELLRSDIAKAILSDLRLLAYHEKDDE